MTSLVPSPEEEPGEKKADRNMMEFYLMTSLVLLALGTGLHFYRKKE